MKKKLKKFLLLAIAEIYLLLRNIWGLLAHPYKTLRKIRLTKDFSQAFLVLGLPFYLWVFLAIFFLLVKLFAMFVRRLPPPLPFWGLVGFLVLTVFLVLAQVYILFWLIFYLRVKLKAREELKR